MGRPVCKLDLHCPFEVRCGQFVFSIALQAGDHAQQRLVTKAPGRRVAEPYVVVSPGLAPFIPFHLVPRQEAASLILLVGQVVPE